MDQELAVTAAYVLSTHFVHTNQSNFLHETTS